MDSSGSSCGWSVSRSTERSRPVNAKHVENGEQPHVTMEKYTGSKPVSTQGTADDTSKDAVLPTAQLVDSGTSIDMTQAKQDNGDGDSVMTYQVVGGYDPAEEDALSATSASLEEPCPEVAFSAEGKAIPLAKEIPAITSASVKPIPDASPRRKLTLQDYHLRQQRRRVAASKAMPYNMKAVQKMVPKLQEKIAGHTGAIDTLSVNMEVLTSAVNEMCTLQKKLLEQYEKQNQLLQEKIEIQKAVQENGVEQVKIMTSLASFFKVFLQTQEARINSEWKGLQEAKSQL